MFGYTDVEPSRLKQLLTNQVVMRVDVRAPTESARTRIPGARNIPLHLLPLREQDFPGELKTGNGARGGARVGQDMSECATLAAPAAAGTGFGVHRHRNRYIHVPRFGE